MQRLIAAEASGITAPRPHRRVSSRRLEPQPRSAASPGAADEPPALGRLAPGIGNNRKGYQGVRQTAAYRGDLHILVEAPDGTMASSTIMWLDEANKTAEFEAVGTHPDYRRLGLVIAGTARHRPDRGPALEPI